ncbi:rac GTPase-activating protein 1 isoform X4 [Hippoglossus hippoglossus]|uniref:rac GTPase-activating protein 1 isoform X4 n=1 Tax=Hippoglossus hippoglossus TaxID=8267 RepID=UPI00148C36CF|nr:rac GTPase-activating protein 1 isoform X4 [Hippoglossus hippoglossus]
MVTDSADLRRIAAAVSQPQVVMGESRVIVEELLALCLQRINMEENMEMVEVVRNFEAVKKRWMLAEVELKKYKELLVKSDVAKAALEVKLKHARNQLDVEMKKRYKMEADYQYLQRQMQLMCDILVHDSKSSSCLNDEQKSLLATFEHRGGNVTQQRSSKRLSVIDESSFLSHSDISYDRTDDDMDLDSTVIKPLRSRVREKRRSSMGPGVGVTVVKRGRGNNVSSELLERKTLEKVSICVTQEVETIVKASVTTPDTQGQIHMVVGITRESPERQECSVVADQTSVWFPSEETEPESEDRSLVTSLHIYRAEKNQKHVFLSKTVIRPETCSPCGKRIRFGKMAVKCRNCRLVAHPECKQKFINGCSATAAGASAPMRGLYRVPGGGRIVKDLRDRFIQGKTSLMLSHIHDVHVVCGLLKDFLRKLNEPLVTFKLHRTFMEASELSDEDNSSAIFYQTIAELPKSNRDTLAFLMLHLHKVIKSPQCQMDQNNLARVFGPTIVGHGISEPSPTTIMRDTNTQPKVICRLLSLPEDYWRRVLAVHSDQMSSLSSTNKTHSQEHGHGPLFQPLTSPELNSYYKSESRGSVRGRIRNALTNTGRVQAGRKFFTSPN